MRHIVYGEVADLFKRPVPVLCSCLLLTLATSFFPVGYAAPLPSGAADAGDPDASFGTTGTVITDIGDHDFAHAVAIQWDGKIIVAGASGPNGNPKARDFALARYHPDGSLDPTFGAGGAIRTRLSVEMDVVQAAALQQDGKIIAAGYSGSLDDPSGPDSLDFALVRYNVDGSIDTTFGNGGRVTTDFGAAEYGNAVVLQPDGTIVLAGYTFRGTQDAGELALAKYRPDGSLDPAFGGAGTVITPVGRRAQARALALQPDGKLVVAGNTRRAGSDDLRIAIARYNSDGSLDRSFGDDGVAITDLSGTWDTAYAIAVQTDGKLVVAGIAGTPPYLDSMLARYNTDGSPDKSFGDGGTVITALSNSNDGALALALQRDGKMIIAGYAVADSGNRDAIIARYTRDGQLDLDFGAANTAGVTIGDFGWDGWAASLVLQPDGRPVAVGSVGVQAGNATDFVVVRLQGDTPHGPPYIWLPIFTKRLWR